MALTIGSQLVGANTCVLTITGSFPAPPYQVIASADWGTRVDTSAHLAGSFRVVLETPPGESCRLYWTIIGGIGGAPATSLDIVNNALLLVGDQTITSLGQNLPRAVLMNALYTPTLDEVLRSHNWNFAQVRAGQGCGLTELTCKPVWEFTYQFALPDGTCAPLFLMALETSLDEEEPWRIEYGCNAGTAYKVLVTDGCSPQLLYIGRIDDVTMWDPLFTDAFTWELAFRACYALTRNATLIEAYRREAQEKWRLAKSRDGQEARMLKRVLSRTFTRVRG